MQCNIGTSRIELVLGDITEQEVDAIVNAANKRLSGGGGVDGAIHRKGGPRIKEDTDARHPDGCATGSAVVGTAGDLPAKCVIHAVGPIWSGGNLGEDGLLTAAYRRALELAVAQDCETVAMPALSTGAYRFPIEEAADIALQTTADFLRRHGRPALVRFVLFDGRAMHAFEAALAKLRDSDG